MRNIFLFIRRYFNFIVFVLLQVFALSFLFRYNKFHQAAFSNVAGELTGRVSERYNNVEQYFKLKKNNEDLLQENLHLRTLLRQNYEPADTSIRFVEDSIRVDSILQYQKYKYYDTKVVGSFATTQTNYLEIHRGSKQGIKVDMGVISPAGIVGRVVAVSDNFSTVMSVLSKHFKVKAKLKKSGENGTVEWDGVSPLFIQLSGIPKSAPVAKGDTILTSELSSIYPPNIMVGTIAEVVNDKSSNFYTLKLKPGTNFFKVEYVYVIEDTQKEERETLKEATKKKEQ